MVGSKIYIPHDTPLSLALEQRLRAFVEEHRPATIAFVRSGDGELAVIETATREQAEKIAAALASSNLDPESLDAVLDGNSSRPGACAPVHRAQAARAGKKLDQSAMVTAD